MKSFGEKKIFGKSFKTLKKKKIHRQLYYFIEIENYKFSSNENYNFLKL